MKKLLTALICLAGATAMTATAAEQTAEFYGFGIHMGNAFTNKSVSYGKIDVTFNPENIGDEWSWSREILFPANFEEAWNTRTINSAWIYNGSLYAARYHFSTCPQDSKNDPDHFWNNVIRMDKEGNLLETINLGYTSKYGYLVKALLNPADNMLYCWTSDFYDGIYFGKISPNKLDKFETEFQEIKSYTFLFSNLPLAFCAKGEEFFYFANDLKLKSITPDGEEKIYGTLKGVLDFTPSQWIIGSDHSGLGMIYSEEIGRFIWTGPKGLETGDDESSNSLSSRAYSFELPAEGETAIENKVIAVRDICGTIPDSYWTAFVAPGNIQEIELGTPKAPANVEITETDTPNVYRISWSEVTECVEEGKALDAANLTYRVVLNDSPVADKIEDNFTLVTIEPQDQPVDYTAYVWAVCPNAESAEASSNTITVGKSGVSGVAAENIMNTIYNVVGTKVNVSSTAELPAGLYIINGKKVMVK